MVAQDLKRDREIFAKETNTVRSLIAAESQNLHLTHWSESPAFSLNRYVLLLLVGCTSSSMRRNYTIAQFRHKLGKKCPERTQ